MEIRAILWSRFAEEMNNRESVAGNILEALREIHKRHVTKLNHMREIALGCSGVRGFVIQVSDYVEQDGLLYHATEKVK
jgi:hypothetical protein